MADNTIIWATLCLAIALVLFFIEIFVPSGGLIGVLAAAATIAGIVLLFMYDTTVGMIGGVVVLLLLPFVFAAGIWMWPNTPIARMLVLKSPKSQQGTTSHGDSAAKAGSLQGATGKALTDLRPVGTCLINGRRIDCLADGPMIEAGTEVRVVSADGMEVKVREA
ncbi:MAG: NfeD family protein [Phycisphaeraceae bacterium]